MHLKQVSNYPLPAGLCLDKSGTIRVPVGFQNWNPVDSYWTVFIPASVTAFHS